MEPTFRPSLMDRVKDAGLCGHVASMCLHAALLFMFATAMASLTEEDRTEIAEDRMATMRGYLHGAGEGVEESTETMPALTDGQPGLGEPRAAQGRSGAGAQGTLGRRDASLEGRASAKSVPSRDSETLERDREREREEAASFGVIGLLAADPAAGADAPSTPWASVLDGTGAANHAGNAWAATIDDARGDGLGLSGGGEGGGGRGEGVGIGNIGTIGRTGGSYPGIRANGQLRGEHTTRSPVLRCGVSLDDPQDTIHVRRCATQVNGRLPPEAIQRVVRQNFGRFRMCYEANLKASPSLQGRVSVKFVIDRSGAVAVAQDAGSDLPSADTIACIVRAFGSLSFPQPEGGIVTVVYPLVLSNE